ncbi:MAG TPA: rod shape-determining protein MreC [Chitinophagaceae bacterium]
MRNIFLFIRRFFTLIAFLALQAVSLWLLFTYNKFHRSKGLGWANEITGKVNSQYKSVDDFFNLKVENQRLHKLNDSLLNLLPANFEKIDTSARRVRDSIPYDTLGNHREYLWREAKVIYNTVNAQKNYIQLNRGSNQGIKDNMSVLNSDGSAVGVVINVSPNYSQVMSLLHVQSRRSVVMKRSGNMGSIEWDGKNPLYLTMKNIPKSDSIVKGDTVLTSINSNFPPGFIVGTVAEIIADKSTNFYVLRLKTAANFYNLQQVHVVERVGYDEQAKLNEDTKKKIDDPKNNNR